MLIWLHCYITFLCQWFWRCFPAPPSAACGPTGQLQLERHKLSAQKSENQPRQVGLRQRIYTRKTEIAKMYQNVITRIQHSRGQKASSHPRPLTSSHCEKLFSLHFMIHAKDALRLSFTLLWTWWVCSGTAKVLAIKRSAWPLNTLSIKASNHLQTLTFGEAKSFRHPKQKKEIPRNLSVDILYLS